MNHLLKSSAKHRRTKQQILEDKQMEVSAKLKPNDHKQQMEAMAQEMQQLRAELQQKDQDHAQQAKEAEHWRNVLMLNASNLKESGLGRVDDQGQFLYDYEITPQEGTAVKKQPDQQIQPRLQPTELFGSSISPMKKSGRSDAAMDQDKEE